MHLHIINKAQAKQLGMKRYFTGVPCNRGHMCERLTSCGNCMECQNLFIRLYREDNKEDVIEKYKKWTDNNIERIRERRKCYYEANKTRLSEYSQVYHKTERSIARRKIYEENNKAKFTAISAARRARKRKATPSWLTQTDKQQIEQIYQTAAYLTSLTGIQFHVDHIIPLRGKYVSGLHIPSNLQILPFYDNLTKSNNYEHDNV